MRAAKDADYDGSYLNVGRAVVFGAFSIIFGLAILALFISAIIGIFRFGLT